MEVLLSAIAIFGLIILIYVSGVFLLSRLLGDNSIMDIAYGPAFMLGAWLTYYLTEATSLTGLVVCTLVSLWAVRLFGRIFLKNYGKPEDARYAAWRHSWQAKGNVYFILRSYLQVNVLQGIIITLVALPLIILIASNTELSLPWLLVGSFVTLFGLGYESLADWQLDQFIARKKAGTESATLMTSGLFHYSRRPNYFGETLVWWGFAIMLLPIPFGYIGIIGPAVITFIVTRVTGPMLEDMFIEKYPVEYRHYKDTTSYFIPWFPKHHD